MHRSICSLVYIHSAVGSHGEARMHLTLFLSSSTACCDSCVPPLCFTSLASGHGVAALRAFVDHGGGRAVPGGGRRGGVVVVHGAFPAHEAPVHRPRRGPPPRHAPAELRVRRDGPEAVAHAQVPPVRRHGLPHVRRAGPGPGDHDGEAPGHGVRVRVAVLLHAHLHQRARPGPRRLPLRHGAQQGGPPLPRAAVPRPQAARGPHVAAAGRAGRRRAVRGLPEAHHRRRGHRVRRRDGHGEAVQAVRGARRRRGPPGGPVVGDQEVRAHGGEGAGGRVGAREPPRGGAAPVRRDGRGDRAGGAHGRRGRHADPDQRRRAGPRVHPRRDQPAAPRPQPRHVAVGGDGGREERRGAAGRGGRVARGRGAQDLPRLRARCHRGARRCHGTREAAQAQGVGRRHQHQQVRLPRGGPRHRGPARRRGGRIVLGLGPAAHAGRVLPLQGLRCRGRGAGVGLRAARGRAVDGDVEPEHCRVHGVRRRRQVRVPGGDAGVQPVAVLQLGRVGDERRGHGGVHPAGGAAGLRVAVHHAGRVPRGRARHGHVREGLRAARDAGVRGEDTEGGEGQRGGDAGAPEVVGRQFLRQGAQDRAGGHLIHCSHGQRGY